MTAAKVMDVIAMVPDCDGQAADAISAYTHVKLEDAPTVLKIPKSECPDVWIRLPRHMWPKSWANIEDPVVLLERNLYGHPSAGLVWERQSEEAFMELGWEKVPNWECLFVISVSIVGCARNKRHYPTVQQNLKSFRWMLDCAWMDYLLSTSGTW